MKIKSERKTSLQSIKTPSEEIQKMILAGLKPILMMYKY